MPTTTPRDALVGEWSVEGSLPVDPPIQIRGRATFEWLEGGAFLIQRSTVEPPEFPNSVSIIGGDDETGEYAMHYFDSRGVARVYQMSLSEEAWKLWRDSPDFSQRFVGTFADDGDTINARWEKSGDGSSWELDFHLTYRKA